MRSLLFLLLFPAMLFAQKNSDSLAFEQLLPEYLNSYNELHAPRLLPDLEATRAQMPGKEQMIAISKAFNAFSGRLAAIKRYRLNERQRIHYDLMKLSMELSLGIINLQMDEADGNGNSKYDGDGENEEAAGEAPAESQRTGEWYALYMKYYYGDGSMNPQKLKVYGESIAAMRDQSLQQIMKETGYEGNAAAFYAYLGSERNLIRSREELLREASGRSGLILQNLRTLLDIELPDVRIEIDGDGRMGRLEGNVLHLPMPANGFPRSALDYILVYQIAGQHVMNQIDAMPPEWKKLCSDHAFREGWSLYATRLGSRLQVYDDPYSKAEALIFQKERAVITRIDYGICFEGWTNEKCVQYWQDALPGNKNGKEIIGEIRKKPGYYSIPAWTGFEIDSKLMASKIYWDRKIKAPEFYSVLLGFGSLPPALVFDRLDRYFTP